MKTKKEVKKVWKDDFSKEKPLHAKVVKEKRVGKPLIHQIDDDDDDLKPITPTTKSFFDEDYDAGDEDEEWEDGDNEEYDDEDDDE